MMVITMSMMISMVVGGDGYGDDGDTDDDDEDDYYGDDDEDDDDVGNADDGRQESYDDAFRDIGLGTVDNIFSFTEPLSFGPFNHLADYERGEIAKNAWNLKQSPLIPYVRELELTMNFKDIAANITSTITNVVTIIF